MQNSLQLLMLSSLLILAGCAGGSSLESNPILNAMVKAEWSEYAQSVKSDDGGLALYVITPNESYFSAAGIENASPDIHFRIASNTKTFTSAAIMLLDQEGKLRIDDRITSEMPGTTQPYVPATPAYDIPYKNQITIRQILSHRAGIYDIDNKAVPTSCDAPYAGHIYTDYPREFDDNHQFSPDELLGVVSHCRLSSFSPGSEYRYSDTGYTLLAEIIERVSGQRYSDFIRDRFLIPNGLTESSAPWLGTDREIPAPFAPGFFILNKVLYPGTEDNMSSHLGEGNIISTPADLARWIRLLVNGETALNEGSVSRMTECISPTSETSCYGLGISRVAEPEPAYGHSGATAGYLSLMLHDPGRDVTTIVFTSLLNFDAATDEFGMLRTVREKAYRILGLL